MEQRVRFELTNRRVAAARVGPLRHLYICMVRERGLEPTIAGATTLHFNQLNYSWDIYGTP